MKSKKDEFLKDCEDIWNDIEKLSPGKREQIRYNIKLYHRSQALTDFFGVEDPEFRSVLDKVFRSRETKKVYFLDILGAVAWANPLFHSYLYWQMPEYERRNRSNIWNLEIQERRLKDKIEERIAKHIDIDDVMPAYNSGCSIDLQVVRILSWSDRDMMSDVAKDLIDLHKECNIPLFYFPKKSLKLALGNGVEQVEFHLALGKDDKPLSKGGCWIYKQGWQKRKPFKKGMFPIVPEKTIQYILENEDCVFAEEKRRELLKEDRKKKRILVINSPTVDKGGFRGSPTGMLYAIGPLIEEIKANSSASRLSDYDTRATRIKKINISGFSHLNILDPIYLTADMEVQLVQKLKQIDPHIVAIGITSPTFHIAEFFAGIVKDRNPETLVIMGGPHCDEVNFDAHENPNNPLLSSNFIDFVISGDAEFMLLTLVKMILDGIETLERAGKAVDADAIKDFVLKKAKEFKTVKGRAKVNFKVDGKIHGFKSSMDEIDLDKLNPLRYEYLSKGHLEDFPIFQNPQTQQTEKCVQVISHRGCRGTCIFCSERVLTYGDTATYYNEKKVESLIDEIRHYVDTLGTQAIFFDDSTFLEDPEYVKEFCKQMKSSGLSERIRWGCLNRFDRVDDDDLMQQMRDAGLDYMYLGLELMDDDSLRKMGKYRRKSARTKQKMTQDIRRALQTLKEKEIRVGVSILFGLPKASEEVEKETIRFVGQMVNADKILLVSLSLFNYHEASVLSQYDQELIGLDYFNVAENMDKQNNPPWNCFEEGGWFHAVNREVDEEYLARLLWEVDQNIRDKNGNKSVLVRKKQLEQFINSAWGKRLLEEPKAFSANNDLKKRSLSYYSVVGDYVRFDDEERKSLSRIYQMILDGLRERRSNSLWLLWGLSRSGKTFFVKQIGKVVRKKGMTYKRIVLAADKTTKRTLNSAFSQLEQSQNPVLCFIDEIAGKTDKEWPFESIREFLDNIQEKKLPITIVLASSEGENIEDLKNHIRERHMGDDVLKRLAPTNEYSVPDIDVCDSVIIALSTIKQACKNANSDIKAVERLALHFIALNPKLETAGQIGKFAARAVERIPQGKRKLRYSDLFETGDTVDPEESRFLNRMKSTDHLVELNGKFVDI